MDERGFAFSLDAVLALIPVLIVAAAVTGLNYDPLTTESHVRLSHSAQDSIEAMAHYKQDDGSNTLQDISNILKENQNDETGIKNAGQIAGSFLNKTLKGANYSLTEETQLKGKVIASNADLNSADNVAVGVKNCDNYTFKLYVWS
ncbi:MAG: hypothetical protein K8E24_010725 [Methanobacterium paludis]|nr:hypothetical protein [Methanobacterium paludis]